MLRNEWTHNDYENRTKYNWNTETTHHLILKVIINMYNNAQFPTLTIYKVELLLPVSKTTVKYCAGVPIPIRPMNSLL